MHKTSGLRDPAAASPLPHTRDDSQDRSQAIQAMGVNALGLAATGLTELLLAASSGSARRSPAPRVSASSSSTGTRLTSAPASPTRGTPGSKRCPRPGRWRARRTGLGQPRGDRVAGLAVTAFICHVGYQVTADVARRLADGVDPVVITTAETAAGFVPWVIHAHAHARWTGRRLRVGIEGWVDPERPARDADALGGQVAAALARQLPEAGSLTWTVRAGPA